MDSRLQSGAKILLVEDDAATRLMIAKHLRGAGHAVTAMESAEQVILETIDPSHAFDVVISDVHLPGTSGIDLASFLLTRCPDQPIVLITGDADEALAREALSRGPVSYLLKPFELFELDAALGQAAARTRLAASRPPVGMGETTEGGWIPDEWLAFVDERSYAGSGHADRVARITLVLADAVPDSVSELRATDLALAARMHELGRLGETTANPAQLAEQGARLLADAGFPPAMVLAVRHLHERWDGTGGPEGLSASDIPVSSLVLSAADSLDHYASAWIQAGMRPRDAVDRAVGLVTMQQGIVFSPIVASAVYRERDRIGELLSDRTEDTPQPALRLA